MLLTWIEGMSPHGYCLAWNPYLILANNVGDLLTFVSYTALSYLIARAYLARQLQVLITHESALMWAGFIWSCGMTHLFGIFTTWHPLYYMSALFKIATGLISVATAYVAVVEGNKLKPSPR